MHGQRAERLRDVLADSEDEARAKASGDPLRAVQKSHAASDRFGIGPGAARCRAEMVAGASSRAAQRRPPT
jgi:hypothetical protein